jgi:predicted RecB family nuclease
MGFEEKMAQAVEALATIPGITPEQARVLVKSGLPNLEALLQAELADLTEIPEIGEQAAAILEAARAEVKRRSISLEPPPETPVA